MSELVHVLWLLLMLVLGAAVIFLLLSLFFQPKRTLDALRGLGRRSVKPGGSERDVESKQ